MGLEEVRAAFLSSGLWIDAQRSMEGVQGADLKPASCPNISPLPDINCAIIEAVAVPQYHTDPALAPVPGGVGGAADWCSPSPQSRTLAQNALLLRPLGGDLDGARNRDQDSSEEINRDSISTLLSANKGQWVAACGSAPSARWFVGRVHGMQVTPYTLCGPARHKSFQPCDLLRLPVLGQSNTDESEEEDIVIAIGAA